VKNEREKKIGDYKEREGENPFKLIERKKEKKKGRIYSNQKRD